jgi:hypothetical protein
MKPTKTKEQIVDAHENTIVLKVISGLLIFGGVVSAIILSGRSNHTLTSIVLAVSLVSAIILMVFAIRCPVCDGFRTPERLEMGIISIKTGGFRCDECNLSSKQMGEYVDLLKRGVDIDGNVIARFNKREL